MPMMNRNVSLPKAALTAVLLLISALSAQGQSDVTRIWPMADRRTESK